MRSGDKGQLSAKLHRAVPSRIDVTVLAVAAGKRHVAKGLETTFEMRSLLVLGNEPGVRRELDDHVCVTAN